MLFKKHAAPLQHCTISATAASGIEIKSPSGSPATLAIVDPHGEVIEMGNHISLAIWDVTTAALRNFLEGNGHLTAVASANSNHDAAAFEAQNRN